MSVCVSGSPIFAANKELNLINSLSEYENHYCLLDLFNQSRDNVRELVRSLPAFESSLVFLEQNFHSCMNAMDLTP